MATVLAVSQAAPTRRRVQAAPVPVSAPMQVSVHEPAVRSEYKPSGGSRPVAALVSIGIVAGMLAAFTAIQVRTDGVPAPKRLVVLSLRSLQPPPPRPRQQPQQVKVAPPPVFAPIPIVTPPLAAPTIVTSDVRVPPQPAPSPVSAAPAPAVEAPAIAASGPIDKGDLSSKMIDATPPSYPIESRRLHEQGIVKLAVTLNTDGRVANVEVASTSGSYRLDRAALGAVRRWRWAPLLQNGVPVMVQGYVTIPFVLKA